MSATFRPDLLQGRRFLVTGATGGAGRTTAIELSRVGGNVMLLGRDTERLCKVRDELMGTGHMIGLLTPNLWLAIQGNYFDGIFHASGIEHMGPFASYSPRMRDAVFDPSVYTAFDICTAIGQRKSSILKDGGSFVLMSSVAAVRGTAGMSIYSASKAAIEGLVRAAAVEWAPRRIRVNAIRAGAFASPMHSRIEAKLTPEQMDEYLRRHPLGLGRPQDIANLAVFLLSDASRWITGSCLACDGGYSAR